MHDFTAHLPPENLPRPACVLAVLAVVRLRRLVCRHAARRCAKLPAEVEIPRRARGLRGAAETSSRTPASACGATSSSSWRACFGRERDIKAGNYVLGRGAHPDRAARQADARRRHAGRGAADRRLDLRAVPRRARREPGPAARHGGAGRRADARAAAGAPSRIRRGCSFPTPISSPRAPATSRSCGAPTGRCSAISPRSGRRSRRAAPYRSPYEALIMASIIEKETGRGSERELIGGVLTNRLRIGMRLQVDPTIIYGLGTSVRRQPEEGATFWRTARTTLIRAPGLPPTPIAMPGRAVAARRDATWRRPMRSTTFRAATARASSRAT